MAIVRGQCQYLRKDRVGSVRKDARKEGKGGIVITVVQYIHLYEM